MGTVYRAFDTVLDRWVAVKLMKGELLNDEKALDDFDRSERMMPEEWQDLAFGLLFQADCHARLGDEDKALACCERLPGDFWSPGIFEAPGGDKTAVAPQLRLIAAEARRRRGEGGASR